MTFDPKDYPANWRKFSLDIRFDRAKGQCECTGECGLHQPSMFTATQEPRRCVERSGEDAKWAKGRIMLTVAHLNAPGGPCQCVPHCAIPEHVKAMCQRCHLRYDNAHFPEDLVFQETGDRSNFQGRYVLRHAWNGTDTCDAATQYRRQLPQRLENEARTLASLTGWGLDDIRRQMR